MDGAEKAKARYQAVMYSRPVNEKEMLEAHKIGMVLQSNRELRQDEREALSYAKASLEASAYMISPYNQIL